MALSIASKNQEEFYKVYALCCKKLQTNFEVPAQYASQFIRGPSAGGRQQCHAVPPPPERPATFKQSFHITTNTRTIEFVPEEILSTTMFDEDILEC